MNFKQLYTLIPSHSLEDFPTDLNESQAASLLNAFAVIWHPLLLWKCGTLPKWERADDPPFDVDQILFLIPKPSLSWLSTGWIAKSKDAGATILFDLEKRSEWEEAILNIFQPEPEHDSDVEVHSDVNHQRDFEQSPQNSPDETPGMKTRSAAEMEQKSRSAEESQFKIDPDLVSDFYALGLAWLLMELLSRQMHYYGTSYDDHVERESIAAAHAACQQNTTEAKLHLRSAFEALANAREEFYSVDCYLLDLCLINPQQAKEHLQSQLETNHPFNLMVTGKDLQSISEDQAELIEEMKHRIQDGTLDLVGGEYEELPVPTVTADSWIADLQKGRRLFKAILNTLPTTWARRRFGLTTHLPQMLTQFGYQNCLHLAFDDGLYPENEESKVRLTGCDGTEIDSMTRLPLAADSTTSFLRFPERLAETMQYDHISALIFARWPELRTPWLEDFKRIHQYAPVFGKFVTFQEFINSSDGTGHLTTPQSGEYFPPFLIQHVARKCKDPISQFTRYFQQQSQWSVYSFFFQLSRILTGKELESDSELQFQELAKQNIRFSEPSKASSSFGDLQSTVCKEAKNNLLSLLVSSQESSSARDSSAQSHILLLNTCSFARTVVLDFSKHVTSNQTLKSGGKIKHLQHDEDYQLAIVELPPTGFVFLPLIPHEKQAPLSAKSNPKKSPPLAEESVLRNEFFEVLINPGTGGIAKIKEHGRKPNRLSQQIAYRFPSERTMRIEESDHFREEKSFYSQMVCDSMKITSSGPVMGEIVTEGRIIDQMVSHYASQSEGESESPSAADSSRLPNSSSPVETVDESVLATYRQTVRLYRGRPYVEIDIELEPIQTPKHDPWTNYYALRFAWNDITASLTRSVMETAQPFQGERFESPWYFEIADEEERTTILTQGLPYHRKTGPRMLDTLLIVEGETAKHFQFAVAVNVDYPMQAARDITSDCIILSTSTPPQMGMEGWFFHLSTRNVQIVKLLPLMAERVEVKPSDELFEDDHSSTTISSEEIVPTPMPDQGFAIRLQETEGRAVHTLLRCFKQPTYVRHRDFEGRTIKTCQLQGSDVVLDLGPFEIAELELRW